MAAEVPINTLLAWAALEQHSNARQGMVLQQLFTEDEHCFERLPFDQWGVELGRHQRTLTTIIPLLV